MSLFKLVDVAQLVEHRVVVPVVVGSSPTVHPNLYNRLIKSSGCGAIGSALALGARGCQFESGHPDHFFINNFFPSIFYRQKKHILYTFTSKSLRLKRGTYQ